VHPAPRASHLTGAMNYRLLGSSGLRVSELALGTMTFGEDWGWGSAADEAGRIYRSFRDAGGNFIDTANVYTNGSSERLLGEFMEGHRQEIVLATKYANAAPGTDPNAAGNHRKSIMQALEASLKRLRTDYIDLYWLHIWDKITPVDEVMRAFDDVVRQGKVLYAGVSDAPAWWIAQANTIAQFRGWTGFAGLQIEYSLAERTVERDLIPMAGALKLGVVAWSPLAGGALTGKYNSAEPAESARYASEAMRAFMPEPERQKRIVAALRGIADQTGRSLAQCALAWLRYRDVPVVPIVGARKLAQFEDNLASLSVTLTAEQVNALDQASAIELGFPYELYRRELPRNLMHGGMRDRLLV
jgi:aryl-alcohol dehydrogenase-like predicted oxidoreductase